MPALYARRAGGQPATPSLSDVVTAAIAAYVSLDTRHAPRDAGPACPRKDAYSLVLEAIDRASTAPATAWSRPSSPSASASRARPIREALQRLETQAVLARDGRSLVVASLDHDQLGELYVVRAELEGLAARLAAQHAAPEEIRVLWEMVARDRELVGDPDALARANKRFHHQLHLASHNRYLIQQLEMVRRSMALVATTSLAAAGRAARALDEHEAIVRAIEARDGAAAEEVIRAHISNALETRLLADADRRA